MTNITVCCYYVGITGTIFVLSKQLLKWHVFYIGTSDGNIKYTYYTNPQPGGQFILDASLLDKYKCLQSFVSTKPMCALIIRQIEITNDIAIDKVSHQACNTELQQINDCKSFLKQYQQTTNYKNYANVRGSKAIFYQFYSSKFNNYTMVLHPVGRHYDVFSDSKPSLENRVCFRIDNIRSSLKTNSYGRGGCGLNTFCFAIVDWNAKHIQQRAVWTNSKNMNLKYSANWYAAQGKVEQRFTKTVQSNFFREHQHLSL